MLPAHWTPYPHQAGLGPFPGRNLGPLSERINKGLAGLWHQRPGPPPDTARREQVTAALDRLLDQPRTWTAAQLAQALRADGIPLSTRQTRRYLQSMGAKWRRTVRSLRHKQDPAKVERAKNVLAMLGKGRPRGSSSASTSMSAASAQACPSR
jgi:putative transposase